MSPNGLRPHRRVSHRGTTSISGQTRDGRYCRARYYHPGLHRFISEDPIGCRGRDLNLYSYVRNSPLNWVDPLGLQAIPVPMPRPVPMPPGPTPGTDQAADQLRDFVEGTAEGFRQVIDFWISFARSRGQSDPHTLPRVNPGRNARGKCNPCPEPPPPWEAPGKRHGSTGGSHWHGVFYNQNSETCECYPDRYAGPTRPDPWPPQPQGNR
jgi:RHS repeat-associated protein